MNTIKFIPPTPLLALVCLLFAAPSGEALTYYVATTGNDTNSGLTQALPLRTIQHAITQADMNQNTIIVAAGVYGENITWTNKDLVVRGAGVGSSIIDGGGVGTCLRLVDVPPSASLEGFTVRNGRANNYTGNTGGGMYNLRSRLSVNRCTFVNNSALFYGGGLFNQECTNLTLTACTFANNSCGGDGGAMENWSSSPMLFSCLFMNNSSTGVGGAMDNYSGSSPWLIYCTFSGNGAATGGGVNTSDGTGPALTNCIVWGNAGGEIAGAATVSRSDVLGGYAGVGNLNVDPLFVSSGSGNFRLQAGSPCIDAATTKVIGQISFDLDGNPRFSGSAPDLGAYELWQGPWWYVDRVLGNDANAGAPTAPFATVTKAITAAASNDTIYIKAGNYGADISRITNSLHLRNWGSAGLARIGAP